MLEANRITAPTSPRRTAPSRAGLGEVPGSPTMIRWPSSFAAELGTEICDPGAAPPDPAVGAPPDPGAEILAPARGRERVHGQRGHGDAIHDSRGGSAKVVVLRGREAGIERGDAVVELAQRADAGGAVRIERPRKEPDLAPEAADEVAQEPTLVETVLRQVQGGCRETEVDGRRHSDHRVQFARRVGA